MRGSFALASAHGQHDLVRIIPNEPKLPDGGKLRSGSIEVRWPGGYRFFYWDDIAGRRLQEGALIHDQALEEARALARTKRSELEGSS